MKKKGNNKSHFVTRFISEATEGNNILYVIIIALFIIRIIHQSVKFILESQFIDLGYHYFYSTMARLGFDLFDLEVIEQAKLLNPMRFAGGQAVYSPSYFVLFQPLTYIPFQVLSILWLILSLVMVVLTVIILLRNEKCDGSWLQITFIIVLVTIFQPLYEDLVLGQNNCILLILSVGAWYGFKQRQPWITGFSLAAMAFIKIQFGLLFLFVLLLGEVKVFLISSSWWFLLFIAGLPQLGINHYFKYFVSLKNHTASVASDLHNLSFNALWHRLLGNEINQATILYLITSLVIFIIIYLWSYQHRRVYSTEIPILVGLTMIPVLSPHTEEHHLVITLLPLLYVGIKTGEIPKRVKLLYLISVVLIASRYSWSRFAIAGGTWFMPLLSLKVVGALLLLIVLIKIGSKQFPAKTTINDVTS